MIATDKLSYKDSITAAMTRLGSDPRTRFIGYNTGCGSKGGGTFSGIPADQLIETPLAENLMGGLAIGLALHGYFPVIYFERFDFILNAIDAIVNHLDKIKQLSESRFNPNAIIRVVVGNKMKPLFTGVTHTQDFTGAMRRMVSFPVVTLHSVEEVEQEYAAAHHRLAEGISSTMLVEFKDYY